MTSGENGLRGRRGAALPTPSPGLDEPVTNSEPQRQNDTLPMAGYVKSSLRWILGLIGTMLSLLQFPIAIGLSLAAVLYGIQYTLHTSSSMVCSMPLASRMEICKTKVTSEEKLDAFLVKGLSYGAKLEEMQQLGADSAELPYYLSMGQGSVQNLIIELSVVDVPSKRKLQPLLEEYKDLTDRAVVGQHSLLSTVDALVDRTILINSWAEYEIEQINERDASFLGVMNKAMAHTLGLSLFSTEAELRGAFFELTENVQGQVLKGILDFDGQIALLDKITEMLVTIAYAASGDEKMIERERLKHKSYWKWIFRSHREKMKGFDAKMEMCARFFAHTVEARTVITVTKNKMSEIRQGLVTFQNGLSETSLRLEGGREVPLQLYVGNLRKVIVSLEATKRSTGLQKVERIRKFEESLRF